jgi:hypothetical protein
LHKLFFEILKIVIVKFKIVYIIIYCMLGAFTASAFLEVKIPDCTFGRLRAVRALLQMYGPTSQDAKPRVHPHICFIKGGMNPGLNPGLCVLRFGL